MTLGLKLVLALPALVLVSCAVDKEEASVCTPGETQSCVCPGGKSGAQACEKDGLSWGSCYGCPPVGADAGAEADGSTAADARQPDRSAGGSDRSAAGCIKAVDLLDPAACGAGKVCSIVDSAGKLGCATPGTTAFHQPCIDLSSCVAGSGCLGQSPTALTCLPFCKQGSTTTCPPGSSCGGVFHTSAGDIGLCMPTVKCDIVTGAGCPATQGCYVGDSKGNPVCALAGKTPEAGSCTTSDQCVPGLVCSKLLCRKLCHNTSVCAAPKTCQGIGVVFSAAPTVGICLP